MYKDIQSGSEITNNQYNNLSSGEKFYFIKVDENKEDEDYDIVDLAIDSIIVSEVIENLLDDDNSPDSSDTSSFDGFGGGDFGDGGADGDW